MRYEHLLNVAAKLAVALFIISFLFSCSLPKIIILNDPLSPEEHNNLGRIYESQGNLDGASQQYRDAIAKDRKSTTSLLLLGDVSYHAKHYAEAESAYKKAIHLQPGNGDIYNNLCWIYLDQNSGIEKAEELIKTAIAATPEHRAYYVDTLGVVLLRLGRLSESIVALKEAVAQLPRNNIAYLADSYTHLADAYRAAGDTLRAEEAEKSADQYRTRK